MELTQIDKVLRKFVPDGAGASPTGRVIQAGVEWVEDGTLDGVPVRIYYLLDEEESDLEWGLIDFAPEYIDRIEIYLEHCDLDRIPSRRIDRVLKKYG